MAATKPVKIIVYGIFPTIYNMCAPCCTRDYLLECSPNYPASQIGEYPRSIRENQLFLEELTKRITSEKLPVRISVVSADSLTGLLYSVKYRLGGRLAVIVGNKVIKGRELSIEKVLDLVRSEIAAEKL